VFPNEKRELSAGCTEGRKAGQWAAKKGSPPTHPFLQPALMCSPLARPSVQPDIWRKIHVFHLETRPSILPGQPFCVILTVTHEENAVGFVET